MDRVSRPLVAIATLLAIGRLIPEARAANLEQAWGVALRANQGLRSQQFAGGGIFNYLGNFNSPVYGPLAVSAVTVSNSLLDPDQAQGGGGGNGEGGGIANVFDAETTVDSTAITRNAAIGGGAGAGLGGGAYNDATSTLALSGTVVLLNQAEGSTGIGGGVYTLGTYIADSSTVVKHNHATSGGGNVGP
jgi:hypothetical protein